MLDEILIVNWLLTRRCNLKCNLCGIVRSCNVKKIGYPDIMHFYQNEMDFKTISKLLNHIHKYSPHAFHILYGGEPFLRSDIRDIIKLFQDVVGDKFTIYHNGTMIDEVINICDELQLFRLTASIDPMPEDRSRDFKSQSGLQLLLAAREVGVEDLVATITVDATNYQNLVPTVEKLSNYGIVSNITTYDPPGSDYYDFTIHDPRIDAQNTVYSHMVEEIFLDLKSSDKYLVHYPNLLDVICNHLPRNYRCSKPWSSLTIDADGRIRLCLRIRGVVTPMFTDLLFTNPEYLKCVMKREQNKMCNGCVWTCIMMSEMSLNVTKHSTNQF